MEIGRSVIVCCVFGADTPRRFPVSHIAYKPHDGTANRAAVRLQSQHPSRCGDARKRRLLSKHLFSSQRNRRVAIKRRNNKGRRSRRSRRRGGLRATALGASVRSPQQPATETPRGWPWVSMPRRVGVGPVWRALDGRTLVMNWNDAPPDTNRRRAAASNDDDECSVGSCRAA
jgi:hypothetical protein